MRLVKEIQQLGQQTNQKEHGGEKKSRTTTTTIKTNKQSLKTNNSISPVLKKINGERPAR